VSHGEYADGTDRQTDRRTDTEALHQQTDGLRSITSTDGRTPEHYITLTAKRAQRRKVPVKLE